MDHKSKSAKDQLEALRSRTEIMELKARMVEVRVRIVRAELELEALAEQRSTEAPGADVSDARHVRSQVARMARYRPW